MQIYRIFLSFSLNLSLAVGSFSFSVCEKLIKLIVKPQNYYNLELYIFARLVLLEFVVTKLRDDFLLFFFIFVLVFLFFFLGFFGGGMCELFLFL